MANEAINALGWINGNKKKSPSQNIPNPNGNLGMFMDAPTANGIQSLILQISQVNGTGISAFPNALCLADPSI